MAGKRAGKLLLVEDEHLLRGLIAQFLRGEGFEVIEAADGSQGVGFFGSMKPFEVVLLDLNLPLLPGVEVCRRIKSEQPSQPVIICSAAIVEPNMTRLREMNVEQFLTKPYHPRDLLDRIDFEISHAHAACPESGGIATLSHGPAWRSAQGHSASPSSHTLFKSRILD
jgi:DNA-binding response OmpR family regulator